MSQRDTEPRKRLEEIAETHRWLRSDASALDDSRMREATGLPGWSRGHVLTHLGDLARAFARQARSALEGRIVAVYDDGRPGRDASIEKGAGRSAGELMADLEDGLTRLEEAWAELGPDDWSLPSAYRDSTLLATQLCWWREVHVHYADLEVGYGADDWSDALGEHLVGYLLPRLPENRTTVLLAGDTDRRWEYGTGTPTTVHGLQNTLAAWLTGRPVSRTPKAYGSTDSLPELGPWP
ncbi:maleylpyruvate isomerase family mycothiol-dependent enzyme [Haloactinomyces albus]|uniref:Maleylpyruvate isomerase n=1 Tax=Haloactinomyces albus TaxID=1352928 RepID=A0AAE4CLD1_9ACTN|nr:maleylpyruvate isomerase family mycothiol-dependent enzyme [Haloactinomyces albus]MDR7301226.1 maleylpyruvate isomerase [Haloactinomyces albus]